MSIEYLNINKDQLVELIKNDTKNDLNSLLIEIIKDFVFVKKDLKGLYDLFSPAFDEVYHDLIFNKIKLSKDTRKLFEMFAIPLYKKSPEDQDKIIKEFLS